MAELENVQFSHLHNHTQYSVLQSTMQIGNIIKAAAKDNMPAVAMTDTANMMASFHFVSAILNHNKTAETPMKPIVGCEFNVCEDHKNKSQKDNGYQVVYWQKTKKDITI